MTSVLPSGPGIASHGDEEKLHYVESDTINPNGPKGPSFSYEDRTPASEVTRPLSLSEAEDPHASLTFPEGGLRAWSVVLGVSLRIVEALIWH